MQNVILCLSVDIITGFFLNLQGISVLLKKSFQYCKKKYQDFMEIGERGRVLLGFE